jgi:hypothetical protein
MFDEVVRTVNWHKLAPAFGVGFGVNEIDTVILRDTWIYHSGESWINWVDGKEIMQAAPARIARNMALPQVVIEGEPPYVVASRNPNGAVSIATLPRVSSKRGVHFPLADVTIEAGDGKNPIGIFGRYRSLTIEFSAIPGHFLVMGQDLAGKKAIDITNAVTVRGNKLFLDGKLIDRIGLSAASRNDVSGPGMVVRITRR